MDILKQFPYTDVNEFKKDFLTLMNMSFEMDRQQATLDPSVMHNLPEFQECLKLFKKKYKDIELKTKQDSFKILILFPEKGIKKIFEEAASKVDDIKAIGMDFSDKTSDLEVMEQMVKATGGKLYLEYFASDTKSNTIILKFNKSENAAELIYDKEGILDQKSPEFRLCTFYGCLNGFDKKRDIQKAASTFYKTGRGSFTYHPTMGR